MVTLTLGANTSLATTECQFRITAGNISGWRRSGVALLPVSDKRIPTGNPALLHEPQAWNCWHQQGNEVDGSIDLGRVPPGTDKILVVVYTYGASSSIQGLKNLHLTINHAIAYNCSTKDYGDAALVIAEIYRRDGGWKVRALAEGSAYGLAAMGRRLGIDIDDRDPSRDRNGTTRGRDHDERCEAAAGTGFAVSPNHVLTCAHVIEGLNQFRITSLDGSYPVELVVVDIHNDLALLRVINSPGLAPVTFRDGAGICLGEQVVALGFPLAGLTGRGVQVTQGGVSSLFGLRDDSRLLQFTAPIQPGSSGSPLLDASGLVAGLVTSTLTDAQNMNFAVKSSLVMSFLEAARIQPQRARELPSKAAHELVREAQSSLWRIEATTSDAR